ncbi:MAG: tail fiber domain-containing protein [Candidatus Woesearchaeota archaeon]
MINATGIDINNGLLYVDSVNNKIGIGSILPSSTLDVNGTLSVINKSGDSLLYVDSVNNKIGIGTNSPSSRLEIGNGGVLKVSGSSSPAYPTTGSGVEITYDSDGYYEASGSGVGVGLIQSVDRNIGLYKDFRIRFNNTLFQSGSTATTNLLMLTSSGRVGILTTSPAYTLDVAGQAHASSFPTSSDIRFKENITNVSNAIDKVKKIRAVYFDWNKNYTEMGRSTGHRELGVIGQEIEKVIPEVVTYWGDGNYTAVDYSRLSVLAIQAIKEQQKIIESLNKTITLLNEKIEYLEKKNQNISLEIEILKNLTSNN